MTFTCVGVFVMGDVVNLPLVEKGLINDPGCPGDNLVYPAAVAD